MALLLPAPAPAARWVAGADLSHLRFFEDRGVVYRDETGSAQDPLILLKTRGLNTVRLRLFTSSAEQAEADPYNAINNLDYTLPLALRVKQAGLPFLLDLHFSDSWADPGQQTKPAAWAGLTFAELEQEVYTYTRNTLTAFQQAGATPDRVQVGNEIIGGFLWPDGRVGGAYETAAQWSQFGRLLKSAIRGVRDGAGNPVPRILIHIDRGADWSATRWFFDRLLLEEVPFDEIGQSYYPFWHGSLNDLRYSLNQTALRYGKPLLVVETGFPWSDSTSIEGFPPTPEGQVDYVVALTQILQALPGQLGRGFVWWGSEYVRLPGYNLAGFDRRSFFNFEGRALPVVSVTGQLTAPVRLGVERTGNGISLTWPLSGVGALLKTTPDLGAGWQTVNRTPAWQGDTFRTTLPVTAPGNFYRLQVD